MELPLADAQPGMVLEEPICDRSGRTLVDAGATLDSKKIKMLKAWGVRVLSIQGGQDEAASPDLSDLGEWEQEAAKRFAAEDLNHPFMQKVLHYSALEMAKQQAK